MKGRQFGRYRLLELLGQGMGEVWRAHDTETDRIVVLKVLHR
jgi:serine/threonine protein kinase